MECITNLHVGNGDINYNIIDNEVEKDAVLGTPTINSSGIKGALREYFENKYGKKSPEVNSVFGTEGSETSSGEYKFFSANLLSRPLRVSDGQVSYANTTTLELLHEYVNLCRAFDIYSRIDEKELNNDDINEYISSSKIKEIEGSKTTISNNYPTVSKLIGENWAIIPNWELKNIDLPVIARNKLDDNGISENIWYEEYVPHKSRFYFVILTPDINNLLDKYLDGKVIQFGGNSSIGYGYCKITKAGVSK